MRGEPEPRAKSAVRKLSGRQLAAAAMVGGLSLAAGAAGRADWRWMLAGTVPAVLVSALLLRRKEYAAQNLRTPYGRVVQTVLMMGTLPLMAATLSRAAERINRSPASGAHWIVSLLLILPLLWIGSKERAAFFRAAEIFWLLVSGTVGVILLAGVFQVHGSYLLQLGEDSWKSALWGFSIPGVSIFLMPQLSRTEPLTEENGTGVRWLTGLGILSALMCGLTAGILSMPVCRELERPLFTAVGILGKSARLEGLLSVLWLVPDLTLLGTLSAAWPGRYGRGMGLILAYFLGCSGVFQGFPGWYLSGVVFLLLILSLDLFRRVH